jgi:hypothetical protein
MIIFSPPQLLEERDQLLSQHQRTQSALHEKLITKEARLEQQKAVVYALETDQKERDLQYESEKQKQRLETEHERNLMEEKMGFLEEKLRQVEAGRREDIESQKLRHGDQVDQHVVRRRNVEYWQNLRHGDPVEQHVVRRRNV